MNWVAYCEGRKVATVSRRRHGKGYEICWHARGDSFDRITDVDSAKRHVASLLHGKTIEWRREK